MIFGPQDSTLKRGWGAVQSCDVCGGTWFEHALNRSVDGARLDRCVACALVFLNPLPGPEEVAKWYREDYFMGGGAVSLGEQYLVNADGGIRHGTERFFQLAHRERLRGRRLLEVGAGGGAFIVQCREAGARVTGLELSEFAAQRLRDKHGLDIRLGTVESTDLGAGSFDIVAFTDVLEHVLSPTAFMRGIHRLLAPGGIVFGIAPNLDSTAHYGPEWAGFRHHAEHLYYFGRSSLERLLGKVALEVVEVWSYGEPAEEAEPGGPPPARSRATPLKDALRRLPGLMPAVRAARRWRSLLRASERARLARYRGGLGHDLYFRAVKRQSV